MEIQTEHGGFKISYIEHSNTWRIEDDGEHGTRDKESLRACKEWIDTLLKKTKKGKFERKTVLLNRYERLIKTTVTSYAGMSFSNKPAYWVTNEKGQRSKESGLYVYDEGIVTKYEALAAERDRITSEIEKLTATLVPFLEGQEE
jgi:hypothetical protein